MLRIAKAFANESEDASTQVGCVIVDPVSKTVLSQGWNGLPRKVIAKPERFARPTKYQYFEHGERNALYNAAREGHALNGATCYIVSIPTGLFVCASCARGLVQSGIKRVVIGGPVDWNRADDFHYQESNEIFFDAGVQVDIANE